MGKTNSRSSGPRYRKPEDRPTRDPLPGPGPFRARLAQAELKTFAPVQPMSVTYDLGDPVGRANRLRAMTGCKKCGKMPTFTQVHLELRNQIQVLCKHPHGQHGEGRLLQLLLPAAVRVVSESDPRATACARGGGSMKVVADNEGAAPDESRPVWLGRIPRAVLRAPDRRGRPEHQPGRRRES